MLEVAEHVVAVRQGRADPLRPGREFLVGVGGLAEPEEPERLPREVVGAGVLLVGLGDAPPDPLTPQELACLAPGRMPELDRAPRRRRTS